MRTEAPTSPARSHECDGASSRFIEKQPADEDVARTAMRERDGGRDAQRSVKSAGTRASGRDESEHSCVCTDLDRLRVDPTDQSQETSSQDPCADVQVQLLPTFCAAKTFNALRPTTILQASANIFETFAIQDYPM